jgi:hypothetical protein
MTHAPSQTAGTILSLLLAVCGIGAVLGLVPPAVAPQGAPQARPETDAFDLSTFGEELDCAVPELPDAGADAAVDVEPEELDWLESLPPARSFRRTTLATPPGEHELVKLLWRMTDHGPAPEGNRDHRYQQLVSWKGAKVIVPLEPSYGWPEAELASACGHRGQEPLPELAVFAEGSFRGYVEYRVLATPRAIHVIEHDTSPGDWIHDCQEVHQGPFTECREMSWSLAATLEVALPHHVAVTEAVETITPDGTGSLDCDAGD